MEEPCCRPCLVEELMEALPGGGAVLKALPGGGAGGGPVWGRTCLVKDVRRGVDGA